MNERSRYGKPQELEETSHTFNKKTVYVNRDDSGNVYTPYVKRECDNCEETYFASILHIPNNYAKYCSQGCAVSTERGAHKDSSSEYIGVYWNSRIEKWMAKIMKDGESYYCGSFDDEVEAAKAYDRKARELYNNPKVNFAEKVKEDE